MVPEIQKVRYQSSTVLESERVQNGWCSFDPWKSRRFLMKIKVKKTSLEEGCRK